jgi:hypothetical protein
LRRSLPSGDNHHSSNCDALDLVLLLTVAIDTKPNGNPSLAPNSPTNYVHAPSADYNAMSSIGLCRAMIDMISLSIKQVTLKAKGFPRTSILDMAWRIGRRRLLTQCILAACRYPDCCYRVDKWQIKAEMPKRQKAAFGWLLSAWST